MAETADIHTRIEDVTTLVGEMRTKGVARDAEMQANIDAIAGQIADQEVMIQRLRRSRQVKSGEFDELFESGSGEEDPADEIAFNKSATQAGRLHFAIRGERAYRNAFDNAIRLSRDEKPDPADLEILRGKSALAKVKAPDRIKSALGSDFAGGAGWLAPATMERAIDRLVLEQSPFMSLVSQRPVGSGSYKALMRNLNRETTQNLGQRETPTQNTVENRYIQKTIDVHDQWAYPAVTSDALEDAFIDLEAELTADSAEEFGIEEGRRIWSGTGVGEAFGISTNQSITRQPSGSAATFGMTAVRQLPFRLKGPYLANGRYALSRQALILLIGMREDTGGADTGQYLWQPSTQDGMPSRLNSFPWVMAVDMDAVGANTLPVLFADFRQLYRAVIRRGLRVLRDELTQTPFVLFKMSRRWGGDVWKSEAGIFLKCAAS